MRAWARNENAIETVGLWNKTMNGKGHITEPRVADDDVVKKAVDSALK